MTVWMRVAKEFRFEAAHSLPFLGPDHKCSRMHGHSYRVVVEYAGPVDENTGMVIDYADIKKVVQPVIDALDHQDLNTILSTPTTAEYLAVYIASQIKDIKPSLIRVYETATTYVEYTP